MVGTSGSVSAVSSSSESSSVSSSSAREDSFTEDGGDGSSGVGVSGVAVVVSGSSGSLPGLGRKKLGLDRPLFGMRLGLGLGAPAEGLEDLGGSVVVVVVVVERVDLWDGTGGWDLVLVGWNLL